MEDNPFIKKWRKGLRRIALVYPNAYSSGIANIGLQYIYAYLNSLENVICERFYLDVHNCLRSFESGTHLKDFDVALFSLQFEEDYFNVVKILRAFKGLKIPESVAYEPIEKHYIVKEPTVSYPPTSLLEREVPDILVVLFFIASVLVDIEHITAAIAYVRSNTFGFNPLIMALSMFFGAKVGIITSMILMVLFCGLLMFLSAFYLKKVFQTYPLLIVCILELVFTISHALHL